MEPGELATKRAEHRALREKALKITDVAISEDRSLTEAEVKQLDQMVAQAQSLQTEIEATRVGASAELMKGLEALSRRPEMWQTPDPQTGGLKAGEELAGVKAATVKRGPHAWTKALLEASNRGAFGEKGITGGGTGTVAVGSLGDPAARLGAPGGELLALITVEQWGARGDGSSVSFLRQASRALHAALVPAKAVKPASDIGLDMLTAELWTFAHFVGAVPLQWLQDAANLDQLISSELAYGVQLAVEDGVVNGAGPLPGAPLGILNDPAVPEVDFATDAPGSILAGLTTISAAGYATGVVALSPSDWEAIMVMKDTNERPIYGGSPFSGPSRMLWSTPVVLSNAIPEGVAIVGDIGAAVRMVERQPVQVIAGTVADELIKNLRTFVGEARVSFATVRPQALAKVDLTGTGTFSALSAEPQKAAAKK